VWREGGEYCPADGKPLAVVSETHDPLVGVVLDGRYTLRTLLGAGGMGFVYVAEQVGLGRRVAIKMLFAERMRDPQSVRRFRREGRALAALDHPGCVRVLDVGGSAETPYLVMELALGDALDLVLERAGPLAPQHAVDLAAQVAEALAAAHAVGIVHRDLKPANVQVELRGDRLVGRILDFGLARMDDVGSASESRLTRAGLVFGTPEYMAPEQVKGQQATPRTDLYALGCLLHEALTAAPPFRAPTPAGVLAMQLEDTPPPLTAGGVPVAEAARIEPILRRLMAKDPEERPESAEETAQWLRSLAESLPDAGSAARYFTATSARGGDRATGSTEEGGGRTTTTDVALDVPREIVDAVRARPVDSTIPRVAEVASMATEATADVVTPPFPFAPERAPRHEGAPLLIPPSSPTSEPGTTASPFRGLGGSEHADAVLAEVLSAERRRQRLRWAMTAGAVGVVATLAAMVALRYVPDSTTVRPLSDVSTPRPSVGPLLEELPELPSVRASARALGEMPDVPGVPVASGGAAQRRYEAARRALDAELAARGLRTRDVRAIAELRPLWDEQERAAAEGRYEQAMARLTELATRVDLSGSKALLLARLAAAERRIGQSPSPVQEGGLAALRSTVDEASRTPRATRRFLERLERLERDDEGR
jgi:hypothetical protein